MSMLRLPLIGDFVYVSRLETPDIEQKFTVTGEVDDGYHIVPEGKDPKDNTSMIKYKFPSKKWVVHQAENEFNVRIQLNPELYDLESLYRGESIPDNLIRGDFNYVGEIIDEYRSLFDLYLSTSVYDPEREDDEDSLYSLIMNDETFRINIFEWLKRNYIVDYPKYLIEAIGNAINDPDKRLDLFEWLLNQDIDWTKYRDRDKLRRAYDMISDNVLAEDRDDIFMLLMRMQGLINVTEKKRERSYAESAEHYGSTKILELLRAVPQKAVQVKHLQ